MLGWEYLYPWKCKTYKEEYKRIPTQVKGRAVTVKLVKESIKYGVSYDDLNAYMMDGGTIFFVVYIDKEKGDVLQIYYTVLLPIRIKEIFKQKKDTYYVSLKKFPADNKKENRSYLWCICQCTKTKKFCRD